MKNIPVSGNTALSYDSLSILPSTKGRIRWPWERLWSTFGSKAASSLRHLSEEFPEARGQPCPQVTSAKGGWQSPNPLKPDPLWLCVGSGERAPILSFRIFTSFFLHSGVSLVLRAWKQEHHRLFGPSSGASWEVSGLQSCGISGKFFQSLSEPLCKTAMLDGMILDLEHY